MKTQKAIPSVEEAKKMINEFMSENNILFQHLELFMDDNDIVCIPRDEYDQIKDE